MNETAQEAWKWVWTAFGATITGFAMGWFRRQAAKIREERLRKLAEEIVADVEAWATTYNRSEKAAIAKGIIPIRIGLTSKLEDGPITMSQDKKGEAIKRLVIVDETLSDGEAGQLIEWAVQQMNKDKPRVSP